jgi:hypothetical protein
MYRIINKQHFIRRTTFVAAVARVLLLPGIVTSSLLFTSAYASPPISGSGTYTITSFIITSTTYAGGNTISTATATVIDTGIMTGTFSATFRDVVHADGTSNEDGQGTFTGTVDGSASGTALCISPASTAAPNTVSGIFVCGHGTGGLAGLHAVLTIPVQPSSASIFTYTVQFHFDP